MRLELMDQNGSVTGVTMEISRTDGQICLDGTPVVDTERGPAWYQMTLVCQNATYYSHQTDWNTAVRLLERPPRVPITADTVVCRPDDIPF